MNVNGDQLDLFRDRQREALGAAKKALLPKQREALNKGMVSSEGSNAARKVLTPKSLIDSEGNISASGQGVDCIEQAVGKKTVARCINSSPKDLDNFDAFLPGSKNSFDAKERQYQTTIRRLRSEIVQLQKPAISNATGTQGIQKRSCRGER